jgi:hypothetical protein
LEPDDGELAFNTLVAARILRAYGPIVAPTEEFEPKLTGGERIAGKEITPSVDFAQSLKSRFLEAVEAARTEAGCASSIIAPETQPESAPCWYEIHAIGSRFTPHAHGHTHRGPLDHTRSRLPLAAISAPTESLFYAIRRVGQINAIRTARYDTDVLQLQVSQQIRRSPR